METLACVYAAACQLSFIYTSRRKIGTTSVVASKYLAEEDSFFARWFRKSGINYELSLNYNKVSDANISSLVQEDSGCSKSLQQAVIMMPSTNKYAISFMAAAFAVVLRLMQDHSPPSDV
eukprot:scaffold4494_cov79-Skeletonema_dohrnii-CCMP3373.AAC.3